MLIHNNFVNTMTLIIITPPVRDDDACERGKMSTLTMSRCGESPSSLSAESG